MTLVLPSIMFAPHCEKIYGAALRAYLDDLSTTFVDFTDTQMPKPGCILVLTTLDKTDHELEIRQKIAAYKPGRPVMIGGAQNRDLLLDAINQLRVYRVVYDQAPIEIIVDAIRKTFVAILTELNLQHSIVELTQKTEQLNHSIVSLQKIQQQLLHEERLTTLGRITQGLTQTLNTPLLKLKQFEQTIQAVAKTLKIDNLLKHAASGIHAIQLLLNDIAGFALQKSENIHLQKESLDEVVERVVAFSQFDELGKLRVVNTSLDAKATVLIDRFRIHQVVLNLLRNAFQATEQGDHIEVRTYNHENQAIIEIEDNGSGMPEEVLERLFEAFYSTKGDQGLGLGLRMAKQTVEKHNGQLLVKSQVGVGTTMQIRLQRL